MNPANPISPVTAAMDRALLRLRRGQALEPLEVALRCPPRQVGEFADAAERALVGLRDELIDWLRAHPESGEWARWRATLDRVNAILSVVVGVEYPAAGVQRQPIEQARDALNDLDLD
jgi:hypothetical protein